MKGRTAALVLVGICLALAILLVRGTLSPVAGGAAFAGALVFLGGFSRGFTRQK